MSSTIAVERCDERGLLGQPKLMASGMSAREASDVLFEPEPGGREARSRRGDA